jgi:uncharacterized protein DUF6058
MAYPTTYAAEATDQQVTDLAGRPCPRPAGGRAVAERLAALDERYVREQFVPLDELAAGRTEGPAVVRGWIAGGRMPQPAYRLGDGTDMVAADYFALLDAAGGIGWLPVWFVAEYRQAAREEGLPDAQRDGEEQWAAYLTGGYGVCLRRAHPRTIARKARHLTVIEELLARPAPADEAWAHRMRTEVEGLADIERPGSPLDPPRWGGPMSPQWYGAYLRAYFPRIGG